MFLFKRKFIDWSLINARKICNYVKGLDIMDAVILTLGKDSLFKRKQGCNNSQVCQSHIHNCDASISPLVTVSIENCNQSLGFTEAQFACYSLVRTPWWNWCNIPDIAVSRVFVTENDVMRRLLKAQLSFALPTLFTAVSRLFLETLRKSPIQYEVRSTGQTVRKCMFSIHQAISKKGKILNTAVIIMQLTLAVH